MVLGSLSGLNQDRAQNKIRLPRGFQTSLPCAQNLRLIRPLGRAPILQNGNVAILFSLAMIGIVGVIGVGVDYARAAASRTKLQSGTDAALLAISKQYANNPNLTLAQLTTNAQNFLTAVTVDSNAQIDYSTTSRGSNFGNATAGLSINGSTICLSTKSISASSLSKVLGFTTTNIHATACAAVPVGKAFEIAMALDNTGSMAEYPNGGGTTKMQALQQAASQIVTLMNPNASSPRAAFAIVPFAAAVNIGTKYQAASFIDSNGLSSIHWQNYTKPSGSPNTFVPKSRFDLFTGMNTSWGGCVEERPVPYLTTDVAATSTIPNTLYVPFLYPDEPGSAVGEATFTYGGQTDYSFNSYLDDNGGYCASSTAINNAYITADNNVAAPNPQGTGGTKLCKYKGQSVANVNSAVSGVNGGSGLFPAGPNFGCTSEALQSLTTDNSALATEINGMSPNGDTTLVAGFMWAWRTISPNGPFLGQANNTVGPQNPVAYNSTQVKKIIIFMTDGYDHWVTNSYSPYQSLYSSLGYYFNGRISTYGASAGTTNSSNYRAQMDAALLDACTNAKATGITVYTVGFSVSSDPIDQTGINTLQSCATNSGDAFIATNASEILAVFQTIAAAISKLRLSQ
eukprot:gene6190-6257_t